MSIRVARDGGVATITVDRPEAMNALDVEHAEELRDRLVELARDDGARVVVLTGAGEKAFIAGADIKYMQSLGVLEARRWGELGHACGSLLETMPKPTVAAVNGYALGGGCELALACDIRVAADTAKFGQPELGLGIIPGAGATQRLPRIVGMGWAKYLILTGEIIDAKQALQIGLVTAIMPASQLHVRARELAKKILRQGPLAARLAKLALNASARVDLDSGLLIETLAQAICYDSEDKQEGTAAFLEKRKPKFRGE